jgi:hypothetical protein
MKKITLLLTILVLAIIGCSKTDNNAAVSPAITTNIPTVDYATLIVGSWQLVEMGMPMDGNSKGCGEGSSNSNNYAWTRATNVEKLTFKTDGAFQQEASSDASCKGSYLLGSGYISITTDCATVAPRQPIVAIGKTALVLEKSDGDHSVQYKYERL